MALLCSCGKRAGDDSATEKSFHVEGNLITVADRSPVLQHIRIEAAETGDYRVSFTCSGVAQAIPSRYAEIASPFAGRIVKSFVRLGQKIAPGSPVFEISSPAFYETGKAYYQARQEMELARKNLSRERDLLANGVGVAKDAEEAEVAYELRKQDYEQALAAMQAYQIDPDETALGQPLTVRSPIGGEVVKAQIVVGQYIREDADALAVVADLDKVWIKAHVKEKDIALIGGTTEVAITLAALPGETLAGTIYYTGDLLDEATRSVEVIIECDNRERKIKPFMYGSVLFTNAARQAILVPDKAVLQDEDDRYVVVSEGGNKFRKAVVTAAPASDARTVILAGIRAGEQIVTDGVFYFIDAR
jgi:cobalt-zinc-cadmium efflux system membrane fusion protein